MRTTVFIEKMKTYVKCGVLEEERKLGVQLELSVYVTSKEFIDYQELYNLLEELSKETYTYLEDFAKKIVELIRKKWYIESAKVRVCKLSVPFKHSFERAGIEIEWVRDEEGRDKV